MTQDSSDEEEEDFLYGGSTGVTIAMGTVEDPIKEDLAKPEFEGLWNKQHKAYKVRVKWIFMSYTWIWMNH